MQSMNQNHEEIICEIKKLRDGLKPPMPSAYDRAMQVLEKLFIPIAIAILAWTGTQAATRISEGQLHLAETSAKNQQEETKRAMQAKYIEIIYKEINSGSENNQMNAIRLVRLFDTELAQNLLSLVAATPGISKAVAIKADETRRQVESLIPLNGYKVGIYFPSNDPPSIPRVLEIEKKIRESGFNGIIQRYPSDSSFFAKVTAPEGLEIRYESGIEDEAAEALLSIVATEEKKNLWSKRQVSNRTVNFISIFIPTGG